MKSAVAPVSDPTRPLLDLPTAAAVARDASDEAKDHLLRLASIGELTASILHEANGQIMCVLLNVDRLERASRDAQSQESLRAVREGVQAIRELSRSVTLLARDAAPRFAPVDVSAIVRAALRLTAARVHSVARVVEVLGVTPPVRGDATLLLQVAVNVLLNAADACEARGPEIGLVRVTVGTDEGSDVLVSFFDTGIGLSLEQATRVFDPFFTTKEPGKGTGLGLSLAKRIVEDVGGRITFRSDPGVGTVVCLVLPAMKQEE